MTVGIATPSPDFEEECYADGHSHVHWRGIRIQGGEHFDAYLLGPVHDRLVDRELLDQLEAELAALATTQMATEAVAALLRSQTVPQPWEVGEAIAECLLEERLGAVWPWNPQRDKRVPRASLPGADLVGFLPRGGELLVLLGEVKTSHDQDCPPGVMTGRSGMTHQIDTLASNLEVHFTLLKWLRARCTTAPYQDHYRRAARAYIQSSGRRLAIFGILIRDTSPNALDLSGRGAALAASTSPLTQIELIALYCPRHIEEWPRLLSTGTVGDAH